MMARGVTACCRTATKLLFLQRNSAFRFTLAPAMYLTFHTGAGVGTGEPQSENACGSFSDGYWK